MLGACIGALPLLGCSETVDSIGSDEPIELSERTAELGSLPCRAPSPNVFLEFVGANTDAVRAKIDAAFQQLFHGDPQQESFYVSLDQSRAFIWDTVHGDVRSEGLGLGMNITVKLGKRDEFDRLWRYSKSTLKIAEGAAQGYFLSRCDSPSGAVDCVDPFGMEQLAMALVFAHQRWGSGSGDIDYEADALELLHLLIGKESDNGGVIDGVTSVFDGEALLPRDLPYEDADGYTRPAVVIPAYYDLWAAVTGERLWKSTASAGRLFLQSAAHSQTGLFPVRANFDGSPVEGWATYAPEAYRTQLNVVLDWIWGSDPLWPVSESNRLIRFFAGRAESEVCKEFTLDGATCLVSEFTPSLLVTNGVAGVSATALEREAFIRALWEQPIPTGSDRYYAGLLYVIGLMIAGGEYPICSF